jgi:hypothetical protein
MNSKNMGGILGWTVFFFLILVVVVALFLAKTEFVDGNVIDAGYVTEFESVSTFKEYNGPYGEAAAVKNFYLVIEANGKTSTHTIEYGTFVKAMTGQAVFKMWCTPFYCTLIE